MRWKFWNKEKPNDDGTTITVTKMPGGSQIHIIAKTSDKAYNLYKKLKKEEST